MSTVLVADDDADILELVAFRLARAGHEVSRASDGPAALAAAYRRVPDVAVLDVTMPGLSGTEVCRALRADPRTAHTKVILLTARADLAAEPEGADDYLAKPFSPRELLDRVQALAR